MNIAAHSLLAPCIFSVLCRFNQEANLIEYLLFNYPISPWSMSQLRHSHGPEALALFGECISWGGSEFSCPNKLALIALLVYSLALTIHIFLSFVKAENFFIGLESIPVFRSQEAKSATTPKCPGRNFELIFGSVVSKCCEKELPQGLALCRPIGSIAVGFFWREEKESQKLINERHCIWAWKSSTWGPSQEDQELRPVWMLQTLFQKTNKQTSATISPSLTYPTKWIQQK